ncbi:DUF4955 domain-containing protein, partial [Lutibacter sp. HS1-25]|uniref:DUF4955 domain-containing protein n=1 Tax=Lutibacter sp. HS1-25 TaxID=2485000 RepID=UPI00101389DF
TNSVDITQVTKEIKKGDFEIEVASAANLSIGQYVDLYQRTPANLEANMPGLTPNIRWTPIINNGIRPYEKHVITKIAGNKITFKNPVQLNMPLSSTTVLKTFQTITEVGVEDILFTSGWKHYPEDFLHHASDIVDYAWQAVAFNNVANGWIRNCHFKDWNEGICIEKSIAVTVKDIEFSGKKGHTSYYSRYSYGVLFENCIDNVSEGLSKDPDKGMLHGPGMRWSTTSTVFVNCNMQTNQSIDCHGYHPYANLLDNVRGGILSGSGGAETAYPNSGPYLTFWNFKHNASFTNKTYDFWFISNTTSRHTNTFAYPLFVGFQAAVGKNITFKNEGLDELRNNQVYPNSLFDAQLQLRLYGGYMSASSSKVNAEAKLSNDGDDSTFWESNSAGTGQWLMLDLGVNKTVNKIIVKEVSAAINEWKLEYWDGANWEIITAGTQIGEEKTILFDAVFARKIRFSIVNMLAGKESASVLINEFKIIPKPLQLPNDNFSISTVGETCVNKNNGKIIIIANAPYSYAAKINDVSYPFSNDVTIDNLSPGTYDLCITVEGDTFEQFYKVSIAEASNLSGKILVDKKTASVSIAEGTAPYTVLKNGKTILETYQTDFSVEINHGDQLQIQSKSACQGVLSKSIDLLENVRVYPNPTNGLFEMYLPEGIKTANIEIYNTQSQLISSQTYTVQGGSVSLNISDKPVGVYFVKLNLEKPVFVKVVKK